MIEYFSTKPFEFSKKNPAQTTLSAFAYSVDAIISARASIIR
jgi:hypothetical protein